MAIERALLSVYDKTGVAEFARRLAALGVEIVSTGGTAKLLRKAGLRVRDVAELTEWPEMLSGRVKTLHARVHAGILFRRASAEDRAELARQKIPAIDLVAVNLYPFEATAARPSLVPDDLIENIDIGGPAMLRSAAKNFLSVGVVCDPVDYSRVAEELETSGGLSLPTRLELARKAFALAARYDALIATELERLQADGGVELGEPPRLPERLSLMLERRAPLRYGENPHQRAALYVRAGGPVAGLAAATQLQGKELSYNNLVDLDTAWRLVSEFPRPAAAIIKHTNPCGAAEQDRLADAYRRALECDPVSAYGGVMAFNRLLDRETAAEVARLFVECIAAPGCEPGAEELLKGKKNLRLLAMPLDPEPATLELRCIFGGVLVQEPDRHTLREQDWKIVTERAPSREEVTALEFGWKVSKHVKSNAVVFARPGQLLGVGAGQMSRVDSVRIAAMRARLPLAGSAVASDAFFPFPDGVEEAARAGACAVIQPGGSVRDPEVVAAANRLGLAMVFTGIRHFRH